MLFALILGAILGFVPVGATTAFLVLAASLAVKALVDVRYDKLPYIDQPSPYLLYCHNLVERGESTSFAWLSYVVQLFVFGMIFGGGLLAFARYLRP